MGRSRRPALLFATLAALSQPCTALPASAQSSVPAEPWFGLPLPPGFLPHAVPVIIGPRVVPATVPAGEGGSPELEAAQIFEDLRAIVDFSRDSRLRREVGEGQLWGRITGFPSSARTIEWATRKFRDAGIERVELQSFQQSGNASLWLPLSWEVRLLGDPAFGPGSADLVLESAMPLSPSEIPGGTLTAPLFYVSNATPAELEGVDVSGKVVLQTVIPQGHMVFERGPTVSRAQDLMDRGAVAVLNAVHLPGNERSRDFSNCGGPCFNLGGRDGFFLEKLLSAATEAGVADRARVSLTLRAQAFSGLEAVNGIAVIPGSASEDAIVLNAHADAWFDGAGDNGDGLAVLVALARHFAAPENRLERTLVFVASAGHHTPGLNGPGNFIAMNPDLARNAVLVINIEHVAQRNISPARSVFPDGYREYIADSGEAPIVAGVTNRSPFIEEVLQEGVARYGVNLVSEGSAMSSGETGGYGPLGVARVTVMQAPPLYHTSGEVLDVVSAPGLERAARFFAYFLKEMSGAPAEWINP